MAKLTRRPLELNRRAERRAARLFAGCAAAAAFAALSPAAPAASTAKPAAHHTTAADAGDDNVAPYTGACETSDVLDVLGDLKDDDRKRDQIASLQGRLLDCSRRISAILALLPAPTPTPYWIASGPAPAAPYTPPPVCRTPPPPATMDSNRIAMYEQLTQCFSYYTYLTNAPAPAPAESTLPRIASRPTFYVYATGAVDSTAAAVLIRSTVDDLTRARRAAGITSDLAIAPRADWTEPANFAAQCQSDPNTRGALVIETSIPETSRRNYFLFIADITNVSASVEMLGCADDDHRPSVSPLSIWSENGVTGKAHETGLTIGILSALAGFLITDRTTTNVSIGGGKTSFSQTTQTAPAGNGAVTSYLADQNLNFPAQNASVQLTVAGRRFAASMMQHLQVVCTSPDLRRIAAEGRPPTGSAPPEHRTLPYKAAALYVDDCIRFANFAVTP